MIINPTYDASITNLSNATQVEAAFAAAAQTFENLYTNNITVNITVYFSSGVGLGESSTSLVGHPTYSQLTNALRAARTTAADSNSVASLPASNPIGSSGWWVPRPQAKALGILGVSPNDTAEDGSIYFASTVSYTFDATNRAVSGKYDFIGVAEHELSEVLGRIYLLNAGPSGYVPYDLFRFTNNAARTFSTNGAGIYFSADNGATPLKFFYSDINSGDIQDWQSSSPADSYDAYISSGKKATISSADLTAVDVLGYKLNFTMSRLTVTNAGAGTFRLNFTNAPGLDFSVLASTNIAVAATNWTVLGAPTENPAGQYEFTDSVNRTARFYRVRLN